jgi:hypothetical protein
MAKTPTREIPMAYNDYDETQIGKSKPKTFAVGDIVTFNGNPNNIFLIESVRIGVAQITYGGTWLQTTYGPNIFPEIYDWIGDSQWTKIDEKKVKKNT